MIQARCIEKIRDNQGRICSYKLLDMTGETREFEADELKNAIKSSCVNVVNLTITSDNRLIDTSENNKRVNTQMIQSLLYQKDIIVLGIGRKLGIKGQLKVESVNKGNNKGTLYRFNDYKILFDEYFESYISIRSVLNETHDIERVYLGFCDSETLKTIAEEYQDFKTTEHEHISTQELWQLINKLVKNTKGHVDVEWY